MAPSYVMQRLGDNIFDNIVKDLKEPMEELRDHLTRKAFSKLAECTNIDSLLNEVVDKMAENECCEVDLMYSVNTGDIYTISYEDYLGFNDSVYDPLDVVLRVYNNLFQYSQLKDTDFLFYCDRYGTANCAREFPLYDFVGKETMIKLVKEFFVNKEKKALEVILKEILGHKEVKWLETQEVLCLIETAQN